MSESENKKNYNNNNQNEKTIFEIMFIDKFNLRKLY
jgi:hypothetical protein